MHAVFRQSFLHLGHVSHSPLVVAGDVVGGGDGAQTAGHSGQIARGNLPSGIDQIPHQKDVLRSLFRYGLQKVHIVLTEGCGMQVAQDHNPAIVEARREGGKCRVCVGNLQGGVIPENQKCCRQNQKQQPDSRPQRTALACTVCHIDMAAPSAAV